MADTPDDEVDLVDLFLYAPVGLLYEYQEIIPKLVKRGKSQVQIGMFLGKMAASKGRSQAEQEAGDVIATLTNLAARGLTEVGQMIGLAPTEETGPFLNETALSSPLVADDAPPAKAKSSAAAKPKSKKQAKQPVSDDSAPTELRLPIAGYDELTAREIVGLLSDLTKAQRKRVRTHESANRKRKTVLAKLDALDAS